MKLTAHEQQSAVWTRLRDHLTERLGALRCQNDGALNEIETARVRGRIAQIKEILSLSQDEKVQAEIDG